MDIKSSYNILFRQNQMDFENSEIVLEKNLKNYFLQGLSPGEVYTLSLKTKVGSGFQEQESRKDLREMVLTKPLPLEWIHTDADVQDKNTQIKVQLNYPDHPSQLKGFHLELSKVKESKDIITSMTLRIPKDEKGFLKKVTNIVLEKLEPATEYEVSVRALCSFKTGKRIKFAPGKSPNETDWKETMTSFSSEKNTKFSTAKIVKK